MKRGKNLTVLVIALCCMAVLTGCKSSDYKKASELFAAGNFEEAWPIFESLADYKDAPALLLECENRIAYDEAISLQEKKDYAGATEIFLSLGAFQDAMERATFCTEMDLAITRFETAKKGLEELNGELDRRLKEAETLAHSEEPALDDTLRPALVNTVSDAKAVKITIPSLPGEPDAINEAAEKMESVDYQAVTEAVATTQEELERSMKQYGLVNVPEEGYIIRCLKTVPGVLEIEAATEDNDPNGNLGKAGAYYSAVYFTHENVNQEEISRKGVTAVEKGTDGGGQIEAYLTPEDAKKRNDYLAGYDGTILASGSHTVLGTLVIRTSNELKASQQRELEAALIEVLTKLD